MSIEARWELLGKAAAGTKKRIEQFLEKKNESAEWQAHGFRFTGSGCPCGGELGTERSS